MFKETNSKKAKRKLEIKELAEVATEEINKNKFLSQTISLYQLQIDNIKKILEIKSKFISSPNNKINTTTNTTTNINLSINGNNNESNIGLSIKNKFLSYYQQLKESVDDIKEANKKILQKYEINYNIIFDDSSLSKIDLNKNRTDIFILDYELKKKNDIIKKLNENLINSRRHSIFRESTREAEINRNIGTNYLNTDNLYLQRDLQVECRNYNKCINRLKKKEQNLKKIRDTEKYLNEAIKYFEEEKGKKKDNKYSNQIKKDKNNGVFNQKNKIKESNVFGLNKKNSLKKRGNNNGNNGFNTTSIEELGKNYFYDNVFEEDNIDQTYMPNINELNSLFFSSDNLKISKKVKEKERKKEMKQKLNFLTVDELFDLDNVEGEKELIIQEELHSDEEVTFEKKIKNKNRINTEYLSQIKKQVPGLYLNQIEFNKKKVMNEADLYSFQRREFNRQNIDENIKTMKKKIKIMKKRIAINQEKLSVLIDFDRKAKEQYKVLKPIKVLSSMKDYNISFMKNEFYNFRTKKKDKNGAIPEVDEKNYATQANNNVDFDEEDDPYDPDNKYNLDDDEDDIDNYSDKWRKKNKINNNIIMTEEANKENKKNKKGKNNMEFDNNDDNKPKSK